MTIKDVVSRTARFLNNVWDRDFPETEVARQAKDADDCWNTLYEVHEEIAAPRGNMKCRFTISCYAWGEACIAMLIAWEEAET